MKDKSKERKSFKLNSAPNPSGDKINTISNLSKGQAKALEEIIHVLQTDHREDSRIIVVQGFSGVGKSHLIEHFCSQSNSQFKDVLHLDPSELVFPNIPLEHMNYDGHIITSANFNDAIGIKSSLDAIEDPCAYGFYSADWSNVRRRKISLIDLQGMNLEETRAFALQLASQTGSKFQDFLAECSLGIYSLIKDFLSIPNINLEIASRLAGIHLIGNLRNVYPRDKYISDFLKIKPSAEILEIYKKPDKIHIYDFLPELRHKMRIWPVDEDVTFLVKKSIEIYTQCIRKHGTGISFHFPSLSEEDFKVLTEMLGFEGLEFKERNDRWHVFDVNQKELHIYLRNHQGEETGLLEWEKAKGYYLNSLRKIARLTMPNSENQSYVYVSVNDHGGANYQPRNLGWMIESFCQHRRIPYFAFNDMCSKNYFFDPEKMTIKAWNSLHH